MIGRVVYWLLFLFHEVGLHRYKLLSLCLIDFEAFLNFPFAFFIGSLVMLVFCLHDFSIDVSRILNSPTIVLL